MPIKVLLFPNFDKKDGLPCTRQVVGKLTELGGEVLLSREHRTYLGDHPGCRYGDFDELLGQCDVLLPIGGDGTLMHAAQHAIRAEKPLLGVNAGTLGFTTQLEGSELDGLRRLVDGNYTISRRMLLEARLSVPGQSTVTYAALNDIVVARGTLGGIASIQVCQGDRLISSTRGDGMIFATPTGSTAYSLSAGGPISDPEMDLVLLTAICPHATFRCTTILPPDRDYTVRRTGEEGDSLLVTADGVNLGTLTHEDVLTVGKSQRSVALIELGLHDFFDQVNIKLSWRRQ